MRKRLLKLIVPAALLFVTGQSTFAQFEQKFTLQTSGGMVMALSPDVFTEIFEFGFSIDAGAQYNFSRKFSIVGMAKYATFIFMPDELFHLEKATYNMLGVSLCPKVRFFTRSRLNPYLYGGLSMNYIGIKFSLDGIETRSKKEPVCFGALGGLGIDYRLNDNIALFWQGGVNRVDYDVIYIDGFFQQIGVNINMFKAKSL